MRLLEEGLFVQLLFKKVCCEYKSCVFLVVLKSYSGSLRVVTTITYLAPALYWKCFYETCFFVVFGFC